MLADGVALRNRCPQGQADPRAAIAGGASGVTMARAGPHPRRARHSSVTTSSGSASPSMRWADVDPRRRPSAPPLSVVPRSASLSPCFLLSRSPRGGVRFRFGWGSLLRSPYTRDGRIADRADELLALFHTDPGHRTLR